MLFIRWNVNPVIFSIGSREIRYYSLLFIAGFILGYYIFIWFYKREKLPLKLLEPLLYVLLGCTIVGARLGHCLFYEPDFYLAHPLEILKTWHGGLASHGGAIGVLLGLIWYARHYGRKYKFDSMWILDHTVIPIAFAGMFIRLGNLMNSEIYGHVTDLPWGFIFLRNGEVLPKHPTQIYEALSYLILGLILIFIYKYKWKKFNRGFIFGFFLIWLFGARFLIEFVKQPQEIFENNMVLNMGQLLSIPFIIAGIIILVRSFYVKSPVCINQEPGAFDPNAPENRKEKKDKNNGTDKNNRKKRR
ncbi:MAG: prolipoprotein diacylglyceryl transferase [Bacteroidales bacterium]|jgi:prolipoprotein diacylglyceryl transferase|nr:prolipoprotein diacylglyceryl transferase [Bacteroidales bacterium]